MYSLLHKCSAQTLLELSADTKFLGATPGIIQVLHTWGQQLNFHPHIHCIVSGGGLSKDLKLKTCRNGFFIPAKVLAAEFCGKLLSSLDALYRAGRLSFSGSCAFLQDPVSWARLKDTLYNTVWCPDIREAFNGFCNAIEYLGRYANRIAITNARVRAVSPESVTFAAKDYRNNSSPIEVTLSCLEFVRRFMMHVLPPGFLKIRYYRFLNNRSRKKDLAILFRIQGHQRFASLLAGLPMDEVLYKAWGYNVHVCTACGCLSMQPLREDPRPQGLTAGTSYVLGLPWREACLPWGNTRSCWYQASSQQARVALQRDIWERLGEYNLHIPAEVPRPATIVKNQIQGTLSFVEGCSFFLP